MLLRFINALTNVEYEWEVTDKALSRILYCFDLQLYENMEDGTYNYFLYDDDEDETLVAQGLAQIGDYKQDNKTYTKEENGYKTYNG